MATFSTYKEWALEVEARGLRTEDTTGYTEDMNGCVFIQAMNNDGQIFGHSCGSPVQETESVLFETEQAYYEWLNR